MVSTSSGTSDSERAAPSANRPALIPSQYACVPSTGKTMRPPVSIQTLARSAKAVVNDRKTASAM